MERSSPLTDRIGGLALVLALLTVGLLCLSPIQSFDTWWHLRTGRLILEEGRIPRTDPYSYTAEGRPWVTHEWLAEVLFHLLNRWGGVRLLVLTKAVAGMLALGLAATAGLIGSSGPGHRTAAALGVVLAGPLLAIRAFLRPHLLTAVLLGLLLVLLRLESHRHGAYRWFLPPLFLLWANLHAGFVLGLLMIALYWLGEALAGPLRLAVPGTPPVWRKRLLAALVTLGCILLNPHHLQAALYPFRLLARPQVRQTIAELRPVTHPAYDGALFRHALVATGVLLVLFLLGRRHRLQTSLLLPTLVLFVLAVRTVRSVSELAILVPAVLAAHGDRLGRRLVLPAGLLAASAGCGLMGLSLTHGIPMGPDEQVRRPGLGIHRANRPEGSLRFLTHHRPAGRIFSNMAFSSLVIHQLWPQRQVFVDGRLDVYPDELLQQYRSLLSQANGWDRAVRRYGIAVVLLDYPRPGDTGLRRRLREDEDWICCFFDDSSLVYLRRGTGNDDLLERYGCPFDPGLRTTASIDAFVENAGAATRRQALRALETMRELAPAARAPALVLGRMLDRTGRHREAVEILRPLLGKERETVQAQLFLGCALAGAGRPEEARTELVQVLARAPGDLLALLTLADLDRQRDPRAAIRWLEQAASAHPMDGLVQLRLGVLTASTGDLPRARRHLQRALRLRPGDPAARANLERLRRLEKR